MPAPSSALAEGKPRRFLSGKDIVLILIIIGLILLTRLPFSADYLTKWDSCNYAFALENFNIADHSPHPPGYPFYIVTAKILNFITGDANQALIIEGMILCSIAAAFIFLAGRELFGRVEGFLAALLFTFSPASWYLSSTALSYMSEAAMISMLLFIALARENDRSLKWPPLMAALVMAIGAGFRIPGFIMCLPLYLLFLLGLNWRWRKISLIIVIAVIAGAYGTVIIATGGWSEYISVVAKESVKHGSAFQKLLANPVGELAKNTSQILLFSRQSLGQFWSLLFLPLVFPQTVFARFTRRKMFIWASILTPLLMFTFVYINLTAIMLILLPIYCLIIVRGFSSFAALFSGLINSHSPEKHRMRHKYVLLAVLSLALVSTMGMNYLTISDGTPPAVNEFSLQGIYRNDLYIETLIETVGEFDSDETCLLLWMEAKHAGYYLRDNHVIWDKYLIRRPSTDDPEIFALYKGRREMIPIRSYDADSMLIFTMDLPEGCHKLIFRGDILDNYIPLEQEQQAVIVNKIYNLWVIENIPDQASLVVNRSMGGGERQWRPRITWSIHGSDK